MTLITLQTDFGLRDAFVAAMKAVILRIAPQVSIVNVTHELDAYDLRTPGLNWLGLIDHCPPGTIHVGVIDPGVGTDRAIVLVEQQQQWFLVPDNGVLTPLLARLGLPTAAYRVENEQWRATHPHPTFHGRDIFAPVAAHLALGADPAHAGPALDPAQLQRSPWPTPSVSIGRVEGEVLHIDRFGNCWTNLRMPELIAAGLVPNTARIELGGQEIVGIQPNYGVAIGALVGVVNSIGYIEVALVQGHAADRLGVRIGDPIVVS